MPTIIGVFVQNNNIVNIINEKRQHILHTIISQQKRNFLEFVSSLRYTLYTSLKRTLLFPLLLLTQSFHQLSRHSAFSIEPHIAQIYFKSIDV